MQTKHPNYDKAFKTEAVRLVQTSGKSMSQVSKDLGVADSSLSRWCQEYGHQGERAFVGSGHQQPEEEELRRLHKEIEVLRQERDILKKSPIEFLPAEFTPMMPQHQLDLFSSFLDV